jgi:hypothetical protein
MMSLVGWRLVLLLLPLLLLHAVVVVVVPLAEEGWSVGVGRGVGGRPVFFYE